jgi:probable rRNA maturation factor
MYSFFSEDINFKIEQEFLIEELITFIIKFFNKEVGEISYIFTSDDYLLKVNIEHLNHNFYTDVITFDYCVDTIVSGDIFISIDRVKENSLEFSQNFTNEFLRVIVHGVLHLLGFNDHSEEEKINMRKLEDKFINNDIVKEFEL